MSRDRRRLKKEQQGRVVQPAKKRDAAKSAATPRTRNQMLEAGNTAIANLLTNLSGGKKLEAGVQAQMETAYGAGFDNVRIHDDEAAHTRAADAGATAFTRDEHIVLGAGAPSLQSAAGKKLLAHELAHVVQKQRAGAQRPGTISREGDEFEVAADSAAAGAMAGQRVDLAANSAPPAIQRQSTSPLGSLVDKALREGLSYTEDGWAVGGVKVKNIELGAEFMYKVLKGDIQGAIELVDPKDPEEKKKLEEKIRQLQKEMEALTPPEERKRREEDEKRRYEELIAREAERFRPPDPQFKLSEPKFGEGFTIGPTTDYVLDDFDIARSTLKKKHQTTLQEIADRSLSHTTAEIEIVGHTDTTGESSFNQTLSVERAEAVKKYLISKGVESGKITVTRGEGLARPRVVEKTKDDRARNRRVEIRYWAGAVERKRKTSGFGVGKLKLDPMP